MRLSKNQLRQIIRESHSESMSGVNSQVRESLSSHEEKAQADSFAMFPGNTIMDLESLHDLWYGRFTSDENLILDQAIALLNRELRG